MSVVEVPKYAYCPEQHRAFRLPPGKTTIWRYLTLPKLLDLLDSRKLFFCRASKFDDPFEGAVPKRTEEYLRSWESARVSEEVRSKHRAERKRMRSSMAISSWHMSEHESAAMWNLYGLTHEGVAIKSTVDRLTRALPEWPKKGWQGPGAIYIGKVDYIDYSTAIFDPSQSYLPYVHKRESFKHESELRAVTLINKAAGEAAASGVTTEFAVTEWGIAIPVDVCALIEGIYIAATAPGWFDRIVRASIERFGFDPNLVRKSAMAEDPIY